MTNSCQNIKKLKILIIMKKITFILFALALSMNMLAKEFSTTVTSKTGEVWYGAYTAKAFNGTPLDQITFQYQSFQF